MSMLLLLTGEWEILARYEAVTSPAPSGGVYGQIRLNFWRSPKFSQVRGVQITYNKDRHDLAEKTAFGAFSSGVLVNCSSLPH